MLRGVELGAMDGKTKPTSFRIPADLYARLQELKNTQAHPRINDSEFYVEAVRLYVILAESFGLNKDLMVAETIGKYRPQKDAPKPEPKKEPGNYVRDSARARRAGLVALAGGNPYCLNHEQHALTERMCRRCPLRVHTREEVVTLDDSGINILDAPLCETVDKWGLEGWKWEGSGKLAPEYPSGF